MRFSLSNRALLCGILVGAVVLTGTACSRSDRSDRSQSGRDTSAAVLPDTSSNAADAGTATNTPRTETAPPSDKDAAGYRPMERDTMTIALQASTDTSSQAEADVSSEAGVAVADAADTTGNAGRIRSAEDSTEILGNVTPDEAADETADEQVIRPEDRETVAASEAPTDEVGAAAIGGDVTGAEAVGLMSRAGVRCAVVDPEANEAVRWDMSSTPVTLNPCGMGSMVLSRMWTAGQGDSGTAGQ